MYKRVLHVFGDAAGASMDRLEIFREFVGFSHLFFFLLVDQSNRMPNRLIHFQCVLKIILHASITYF